MAVPVVLTGKRNPFDSGGPLKLNIADEIDVVAPERDTPFLRMLGWAKSAEQGAASASAGSNSLTFPCTSFPHTWLNDQLVPSSGVTTAAHVAAGATITVGAAAVLYFRIDDILRVHSTDAGVAEVNREIFYIVTAVGATTLDVTVLNTDQNFANGDAWYLMGNAKKVGAAANAEGKYTQIVQTSNHTQIFRDDVYVTGTEQATEQYGITDPFARETTKTFQRMIVQFERAVTFGLRTTTLPTVSTTASRMGGFFYYTRIAAGALNFDLAGAPISEAFLDARLTEMWAAGGNPDFIMCNSTGVNELKNFLRPYVRTSREEHAAGLWMERYESPVGLSVDVLLNRHLGQGDYLIGTKSHLGVGPLAGNGNSRAFSVDVVPYQGGDFDHKTILGEYTMEVRNNLTHHMWIYGGAASVSS